VIALIAAVVGLGVLSIALAAYVVRLRVRLNRRMVFLLDRL
jgi:hypothetical protein